MAEMEPFVIQLTGLAAVHKQMIKMHTNSAL